MLSRLFLQHPQEHGMSYLQHFCHAVSLSLQMFKGSVALLIHGLVPSLLKTTGTETIRALSEQLKKPYVPLFPLGRIVPPTRPLVL